MKEELLPCPFCGGYAEITPYKKNGLKIKCTRCLIEKRQRVRRYSLEWLEEQLIKDWNRRIN